MMFYRSPFVIGLGVTVLCGAHARADQSPKPLGKIAYVSAQGQSSEIFAINADGSHKTNMSRSPEVESRPQWSPDGSKLLFFSSGPNNKQSIRVVSSDGTPLARIQGALSYYSVYWSPDSRLIAFSFLDRNWNNRLCVIGADGRGLTLLNRSSVSITPGIWSPDSRQLVFQGQDEQHEYHLFIIGADGKNQRVFEPDYSGNNPQWSPDGRSIAFVGARKDGTRPSIYVANVNDGSIHPTGGFTHDIYTFSWSPDSRKIAFIYPPDSPDEDGLRLGLTFAEKNKPFFSDLWVTEPWFRWNPNSTQIALEAYRSGHQNIYALDANTGSVTNITRSPEQEADECYSPDGKFIAYTKFAGSVGQIYVASVEGTQQTNISQSTTNDYAPQWAPGTMPTPPRSSVFAPSSPYS